MERYNGDLIVRFEFDGDYQSVATYDGEMTVDVVLDGELESSNAYDGQSSTYQIVSSVDAYTGEYEFTPVATSQTIAIMGKVATQNITINPIPSNYGLITWNGSTLTVS